MNAPAERLASPEAEQSLLGGLLLDNLAYGRVAGLVSAADFYRDDHRRIWRHIVGLLESGKPADVVTVSESIEASEDKDETGGAAYLGALAQNTPSALHVERYAEIVRDRALRRAIDAAAQTISIAARSPGGSGVAELLRQADESLAAIGERALPRYTARPIPWAQLSGKSPPHRLWAASGWIPFGHLTLMPGAGGIGKTLLAQQWSSCMSCGRSFIGDTERPLKVLFWACEDDAAELWRRQIAIAHWMNREISDFDANLAIVARHGLDNALATMVYGRLTFTPLLRELREQAGDLGAEVVILDNSAQIYGGDENTRHSVTYFANGLAGALPGKGILMLSHPARAAGSEFSGSSAWENVARSRLFLGSKLPDQRAGYEDEVPDDVRYLARRKSNYSSKDWRRLTFRGGVLVPDAADELGSGVNADRDGEAERLVLIGLQRLQGMQLEPTDGEQTARYLPKMIVDYRLASGFTRSELASAMRRLMVASKLTRAVVGKYANRAPKYGLKAVL